MKTYYSRDLNIVIEVPETWTCEGDGNILSIYDSTEGVGALQFSSYEVDDIALIDLKSDLEEYVAERHKNFNIQNHNRYAFCKSEDGDGNVWKYWLFTRGNTVVFASYNCSRDDVPKEERKVDAIIKSALE